MKNYQAIACSLHSEYELAILQKRVVSISWKDIDGILYQENLLPYDLLSSKGEEFLVAKTKEDEQRKIRLDYIISVTPLTMPLA